MGAGAPGGTYKFDNGAVDYLPAPARAHGQSAAPAAPGWRHVLGKEGCVGVFDSGVGGISVLRSMVAALPHEDFVFFGDSANAPYGEKSTDEVLRLSRANVERLLDGGAKAIVIACNTATSVAAARLRGDYPDLPIVGVEPALKPATLAPRHDRILVMATPITLKLDKFHKLAQEWGSDSTVIPAPCPGLAARIEQGNLDAPDLTELLERLVGQYRGTVDSVVLGCTHYPFVRRQIRSVVGDVPFFDGAEGTARRLRSLLAKADLLKPEDEPGSVTFETSLSKPGELDLYQWFFNQDC